MSIGGRILRRSSASDTEVHIAGMRELLQGLSDLPLELGKGAIYQALGGAARIVRDEARARAPVISASDPKVIGGERQPGTIRRAIRSSRSKINKGQRGLWEVIVRVKPLKAKQKRAFKASSGKAGRMNPDDPFYWWWLEFGTAKMSARPFLRPAFESTKSQQLAAMRERMRRGIDKAAAKIRAEVNRAAA